MFLFLNDNLLTLFPLLLVIYPTSLCGLPLDSNLETSQWALPPTAFLRGPLQWEPGVSKVPHPVGPYDAAALTASQLWSQQCTRRLAAPAGKPPRIPTVLWWPPGAREWRPNPRRCSLGDSHSSILPSSVKCGYCQYLPHRTESRLGGWPTWESSGNLQGYTHTSCSALRVFGHHRLSRPRGLIR